MTLKGLNYIVLLFFFVLNIHSHASDYSQKVARIDSLIEYTHYQQAEKEIDSLCDILEGQKKYRKEYLELQVHKGTILVEREDNHKSLDLLIKIAEDAEKEKFYRVACIANIRLSLIYEKSRNPEESKRHLDKAESICLKYNFMDLYATILIRRSLYHRFYSKNMDSAKYYILKSLDYLKIYPNEYDYIEADVMWAIYNKEVDYLKTIQSFISATDYYLKTNNYNDALIMFQNISTTFLWNGNLEKALSYSDSAYQYYDRVPLLHKQHWIEKRIDLFKEIGNTDSINKYLYSLIEVTDTLNLENEKSRISEITTKYEAEKKEETIKKRNQLIILLSALILMTSIVTLVFYRMYRRNKEQTDKISQQNFIITQQLEQQQKLIQQKQVLLSELQHRVKNNLQQVISILEIQKESIEYSNMEELVRANQNRIHSMALLHKKLNIQEDINNIDLNVYLKELIDVIQESYLDINSNIKVNSDIKIGKTNLETALPLGLITVELISNSIKHAFKDRKEGFIHISIHWDEKLQKHIFNYSDNGIGFNFKPTEKKGLGIEIIEGLIDQVGGQIKIKKHNGFFISIIF